MEFCRRPLCCCVGRGKVDISTLDFSKLSLKFNIVVRKMNNWNVNVCLLFSFFFPCLFSNQMMFITETNVNKNERNTKKTDEAKEQSWYIQTDGRNYNTHFANTRFTMPTLNQKVRGQKQKIDSNVYDENSIDKIYIIIGVYVFDALYG